MATHYVVTQYDQLLWGHAFSSHALWGHAFIEFCISYAIERSSRE
ncbi:MULTISPECIES: hypothetical protein [unclassified Limnothrix]|nr:MULTISPECIES: hypothetical protein [unclassified Limnothrix]